MSLCSGFNAILLNDFKMEIFEKDSLAVVPFIVSLSLLLYYYHLIPFFS